MSQSQYVNQQLPLQLQNEGVATINAIAGAEAIWGEPLIAPDNAYVIHYYVDGSVIPNSPVDATSAFQSGYQTFLNAPEVGTLEQGASAIGEFYGPNERVGFDTSETYDQYYTSHDQQQFDADSVNAAITARARLYQTIKHEQHPQWGPYDRLDARVRTLIHDFHVKYGQQNGDGGKP
jgi:hypothetical protein